MKKIILTAITIVSFTCFNSSLKAQYMSLGPSIGGGGSWLTYNKDELDQKGHFTWNAGATFVYSTENHLGFGADLKFSQEGYSSEYEIGGEKFDNTVNFGYLRLPLRIIYFFGEYGQNVRPKVFIGPDLGLLVGAKSSVKPGESSVDVMDHYNTVDVGAHLGAGVNIKLAEKLWLNTDVTYYQGFVDVTDDDDATGENENNFNGNVAVNVGVAFGFGGTTPKEMK